MKALLKRNQNGTTSRLSPDLEVPGFRTPGYRIKQVPVNWYNDDKTHIQSFKVFLKTFGELLKIKFNALKGKYR